MPGRLEGKERLIRELEDKSGKLLKGLTLESLGRLVRRTPVDTGRARNNWNVAINRPSNVTDDFPSYPKDGQLALRRGAGPAARIRGGDTVFVTNALPYIEPLEKGSSQQAPEGMIAVTVAELQQVVNAIVRQVKR